MSVKTNPIWLTVCLHYNEPWEEFLVKAVKPYADVVLQTGVAESFFFQRSWERGPHVRLWFKGNPVIFDTLLKPNLEEYFQQYFESRPSLLIEPHYPVEFPATSRWMPNNSLRLFEYQPELERYGGQLEMTLCEKQFHASSRMALKIIKEKLHRWTHHEITGAAVKLHLSLAYAAGMSLQEATDFFSLAFENWRWKHVRNAELSGKSSLSGQPDATLRSFQKIFDLQKSDVVPYHSALWELFKNYRQVEDEDFKNWFQVNANTAIELNLAIESGKLETRPSFFQAEFPGDPEKAALWSHFYNFIHLTNNRLGVHDKNEGFLFYVLAQSLRSVSAVVPAFVRVETSKKEALPAY
ncbi:MAG: lantibiotic dehydratase C-terminal domain-containing protein [Bacteroidota bacterium]|mgnify:CR=1 FL=1